MNVVLAASAEHKTVWTNVRKANSIQVRPSTVGQIESKFLGKKNVKLICGWYFCLLVFVVVVVVVCFVLFCFLAHARIIELELSICGSSLSPELHFQSGFTLLHANTEENC